MRGVSGNLLYSKVKGFAFGLVVVGIFVVTFGYLSILVGSSMEKVLEEPIPQEFFAEMLTEMEQDVNTFLINAPGMSESERNEEGDALLGRINSFLSFKDDKFYWRLIEQSNLDEMKVAVKEQLLMEMGSEPEADAPVQ